MIEGRMPDADIGAAHRFLSLWDTEGPWYLYAINPDIPEGQPGKFSGVTIEVIQAKLLGDWIEQHSGKFNIYFHVNRLSGAGKFGKASKKDVKAVQWLWVDIDAHSTNDVERKRKQDQILHLLRNPPADIPKPTVVVFSGGGYQAYWRLSEAFIVGGDERQAAKIEAYIKQLEKMFGGDACHDVNRIMRLPGTVNILNPKKRREGRTPELSTLIEWNKDRIYPLSMFRPFEEPQAEIRPGRNGSNGHSNGHGTDDDITLSGELPTLGDELDVRERCKAKDWLYDLIMTGVDPRDPGKHGTPPDRSRWAFAAACEMVRRDVDPKVIMSVLIDQRFGIAEHVLSKGGQFMRHARRTVERALIHAEDPTLFEINEKYTLITDGQVRVVKWEHNPQLNREELIEQSIHDFKIRYLSQKVMVGLTAKREPKFKDAGSWWLEHPKRNEARRMLMLPEQEPPPGIFNLWRGWGVKPEKGDWSLMREHIKGVLANDDPKVNEYILRWSAWAVQNPGECAEVALVIPGKKGSGKSVYATTMLDMFGQHGTHVSHMDQVTGKFNGHLIDICMLNSDEAYWAGSMANEGQLKRMITEKTLMVEGKFLNAIQVKNCLKIIMTSNENWVVPATEGERRYAVFRVSPRMIGVRSYWDALFRERREGGVAAMLFDLLDMDLQGWHPRFDIPDTEMLGEQKERSLRGLDAWWNDLIDYGELPGYKPEWEAKRWVRPRDMMHLVEIYCARRKWNVPTQTLLGRYLVERGCTRKPDTAVRGWVFPSLYDCRKEWWQRMGWDTANLTKEDWSFAPYDPMAF